VRHRRMQFGALALVLALGGAACSSNTTDTTTSAGGAQAGEAAAPGKDTKAVGFIFVGPKDDFGYNQAAYQGSQAVKKAYPNLNVLTAENVPETDEAARVMEGMINQGAKVIFATSYGHLDAATKVAAAHPDVAVVQQGNLIKGTAPANLGTYFGTVFEPVYLAGVVAGKTTKTNKLGYVYAFPITQTIENINAFQLGAKSVNPAAQTYVVNTSQWCDPAKQADAAKSLFDQGVDVITQHQDCTATITKAAEAAGKFVVGYHADASPLAPKGWLSGS
jgi:basic membrane protein A